MGTYWITVGTKGYYPDEDEMREFTDNVEEAIGEEHTVLVSTPGASPADLPELGRLIEVVARKTALEVLNNLIEADAIVADAVREWFVQKNDVSIELDESRWVEGPDRQTPFWKKAEEIEERLRELHGTATPHEAGGLSPYAEAQALLWVMGYDDSEPAWYYGGDEFGWPSRVDVSDYIEGVTPIGEDEGND